MPSRCSGGTWNDYNEVFIIQVPKCNLRCPYCFVDRELFKRPGRAFSHEEIFSIWESAGRPGLFRISGGEPSLHPQAVAELAAFLIDVVPELFVWIDTNLVGNVAELARLLPRDDRVAVNGCFKAFTDADFERFTGAPRSMFAHQFNNARALIEGGVRTFFYVPCLASAAGGVDPIGEFFARLQREVHRHAPLLVTPIRIKRYECNREAHAWLDLYGSEQEKIREQWLELLWGHYPPTLTWLPSHQVPL